MQPTGQSTGQSTGNLFYHYPPTRRLRQDDLDKIKQQQADCNTAKTNHAQGSLRHLQHCLVHIFNPAGINERQDAFQYQQQGDSVEQIMPVHAKQSRAYCGYEAAGCLLARSPLK